jgi:uncharacterized protein
MFKRDIEQEVRAGAASYPIMTVIGPRQSGKTTLAKAVFKHKPYVNLEDPDEREFALSDPKRFLAQFNRGAVLDEIQRVPELLSYLQVLVDERNDKGLFILTGSHQLSLQQGISQSLAGRTGILHLFPLSLHELAKADQSLSLEQQIFFGGYPRIYQQKITPQRFYRDYVQTYIERDVKLLINIKDLDQFQRFLYLCAARTGSLVDYTAMANDLGIARKTITEWLSVLKASFIIYSLPPYFENFGKRVIKSSKLYFTDVGLASYLLGIQQPEQIIRHPLRGELFENLVLTELVKTLQNKGQEARLYFYRDSNQNEVDIVFQYQGKLQALEIKSTQTFRKLLLKNLERFKALTKNIVLQNTLIYAGDREQMVGDIQVLNYENIKNFLDDKALD